MRIAKCEHCGAEVYVDPSREPVRYVVREADDLDPKAFLIIGGDWLLHRCVLDDHETRGRRISHRAGSGR